MNIVCGTDFSVQATEAANVAAALAARFRSALTLVHAIEPSQMNFLSGTHVNWLRRKLGRKLVKEGNRLRECEADVTENLTLGRPHDVLASSAKRSKAGLIVVASVGRVSPIHWLAGSVAERIAQSAAVPTLVVRNHESLLAWIRGKRPLNVFVGHDFSASSDAALRWVASLKNIGRCNITVTHISWPPSETWRFGIGPDANNGTNPTEIQELLQRDLKERCALMLGKTKATLKVVSGWGRQDAHLIELAKANDADLIVVGTNQRRGLKRFWLGSTSRGVLRHAPTNVACISMTPELSEPQKRIPTFKRVLVPTNFSKLGDKAIAFAYGAAKRGGEVSLVHVIPPRGGFKMDGERTVTDGAERKDNLVARLQSLIPKSADSRGVQSRIEVVEHQHPAAAICQAAERSGAELICIGSRGRSGLKRKLLGSVTESVMKRSHRPVMVIRA